ncbi:MAG: hypothetical protein EHM19_07975 [Candidatus Latescibacterota bacterium]|nr:MAG: hypothetical protein EHM19_07975 [Candidatus Latescibacterota bacterium]
MFSPQVERSHRSDQEKFYQLLTYTGDVDPNAKLEEWEWFYEYGRPHGALDGKTPCEKLRSLLQSREETAYEIWINTERTSLVP